MTLFKLVSSLLIFLQNTGHVWLRVRSNGRQHLWNIERYDPGLYELDDRDICMCRETCIR